MIRKSGNRFSDKIMRHETPYLYICALAASIARQSPVPMGRDDYREAGKHHLDHMRTALASARRTGKLPQSSVMQFFEWMARRAG
jgi:hypothetical protein